MNAIRIRKPGGLDALLCADLPEPGAPGPSELLVRLRASSLNYHDYLVATGAMATSDGRIPLSDGAGEVVAMGSDVTEFKIGDAVISTFFPNWLAGNPIEGRLDAVPGDYADGYAREWVIAPATAFTGVPKGYQHYESATLPCAGLTAWRALVVEGQLKAGDSVLVQGTGGVSIFALQFAKAMGATVIATSSSDAKLERLAALGADHLINYRTTPKWGSAARAMSGAGGVDHVIEVGGAGTIEHSISAARVGGHIAVIGVLTGIRAEVTTATVMAKQLRVIGIGVGSRSHQKAMIRAIDATGLRPVVDSRFPLVELSRAFRHQESGAHFGKICIDIG